MPLTEPRRLLGIFWISLIIPLAADAAQVGVNYDRGVDFSNYRTYNWVAEAEKPAGSPLAPGGEIDTKIRNAVDARLREQGYEPAVSSEPDFLIGYDGSLEPVTQVEGKRMELFAGIDWVVDGQLRSYSRGTLILIIRDARGDAPVWRAWTTEEVKKPSNPDPQIRKVVKKLLRRFPPH